MASNVGAMNAAQTATSSIGVGYTFMGLRELSGRFGAMVDYELQAIVEEAAVRLGDEIRDVYRNAAPKSGQPVQSPRAHPFAESIVAEVSAAPGGFLMTVQTDQPDVRDYIRYGHRSLGPEDLKTAKAFHFVIDGEDIFTTRISAVAPNDWEGRAEQAVWPAVEWQGNRIAAQVVRGLEMGEAGALLG